MCYIGSLVIIIFSVEIALVSSAIVGSTISCDPWPEQGGNDKGPAGVVKSNHYDCQSLGPIHCIDGNECSVYCEEDIANRRRRQLLQDAQANGCDGIQIYCPSLSICNIFCTYSCNGMTVHAETSTVLNIMQCGANQMTDTGCDDITVYCPLSSHKDTGRTCYIGDSADKAITGLHIYADGSFSDINISPINLVGVNIMHCGASTEQNCVIDANAKYQCTSYHACDITNNAAPTTPPAVISFMPSASPTKSTASMSPTKFPYAAPTEIASTNNPSHEPSESPIETITSLSRTQFPTKDPLSNMASAEPTEADTDTTHMTSKSIVPTEVTGVVTVDEGSITTVSNGQNFGNQHKAKTDNLWLWIGIGGIGFFIVSGLFAVFLFHKKKLQKRERQETERRRSIKMLTHTIPRSHPGSPDTFASRETREETMTSVGLSERERERHQILPIEEEEDDANDTRHVSVTEDSFLKNATMTQNASYVFGRGALNVVENDNVYT